LGIIKIFENKIYFTYVILYTKVLFSVFVVGGDLVETIPSALRVHEVVVERSADGSQI
jgi:hypothetical protein